MWVRLSAVQIEICKSEPAREKRNVGAQPSERLMNIKR